jgi:hypothetical protein
MSEEAPVAEGVRLTVLLTLSYGTASMPLGGVELTAVRPTLIEGPLPPGERERGTARLEEAVAAHRAALEERTRDRVPLLWATTQNSLGAALTSVGGVVTAGSPVTLYAKAGSQPTALIDLTPAPPQSATQCRVSLSGLLTP